MIDPISNNDPDLDSIWKDRFFSDTVLNQRIQSIMKEVFYEKGSSNPTALGEIWDESSLNTKIDFICDLTRKLNQKKEEVYNLLSSEYSDKEDINLQNDMLYGFIISQFFKDIHSYPYPSYDPLKRELCEPTKFLSICKVETETLRGQIARALVVEDQLMTLDDLKICNLKNNQLLFRHFKSMLECEGRADMVSVMSLKSVITDQDQLGELALLAAKNRYSQISKYIQNYGITNPNTLTKIALIQIETNPSELLKNLENYGFKNQEDLDRILLSAAEKKHSVSEYINKFGNIDKNTLNQIALHESKNPLAQLSKYIKDYGITDQDLLIKLAQTEAENSLKIPSEFIENYGIKDRKALEDIAMRESKNPLSQLSKYIKNFGITDQNLLVTLAENEAINSLYGPSQYIQNYEIINEEDRFRIAMKAVKGYSDSELNPNVTAPSIYIQNYGIKDQRMLYEIAKLEARIKPMLLPRYIQNFGISDQKILLDIVMIISKTPGVELSKYIQNFNINDPQVLFQIASQRITKDLVDVVFNLMNYKITDSKDITYLAQKACFFHTYNNLSLYSSYHLWRPEQLEKLLCTYSFINEDTLQVDEKIFNSTGFTSKFPPDENLIYIPEKVIKALPGLPIPFEYSVFEVYVSSIAQIVAIRERLGIKKYYEVCNIIEQVFLIKNPELRVHLLSKIFDLDDNQILTQKALRAKYGNITCQIVPYMLLAILSHQGVGTVSFNISEDSIEETNAIEVMAKSVKQFKSHGNLVYKDAIAYQRLLNLLLCLIEDKSLKPEDKDNILLYLGTISEKSNLVFALNAFIGIKDLNSDLHCFSNEEITLDRIKSEFELAFKNSTGDLNTIEDFALKLEETLKTFRSPHSFYSYIGKMKQLPFKEGELMLKAFNLFVSELLQNTYHENRYLGSPHLKAVYEKVPRLKELWPANREIDFKIENVDEPALPFNIKELVTRSIKENHDKGLLTDGQDVIQFKDPSVKDRRDFIGNLNRLVESNENNNAVLQLQLKKCIDSAPTEIKNTQFFRDLGDWQQMLIRAQKKVDTTEWKIVNTDDPCDLFLCGTEVIGSCQSVEGTPDLNKCLLGYVLDGKNRLIAIKDKSGKIQSRAILRLLLTKEGEPALFMERIYPSLIPASHRKALIAFAKENANALGLRLYSSDEGFGSFSYTKLFSKSCRAPYEYVDNSGGPRKDGIWDCFAKRLIYPDSSPSP